MRLGKYLSAEDRFHMKYVVSLDSGCWLWLDRPRNEYGHGEFVVNGRRYMAHRWSYELYRGPIPAGLHIDHLCRVPRCVNPDHLEAVSPRTNVMRGTSVVAVYARKTHCSRGHPFDDRNTYRRRGRDWRECRECRNEAQRKHRMKMKASAEGCGSIEAVLERFR